MAIWDKPLPPKPVPTPDVISAPEAADPKGLIPRAPFWDLSPGGVYVQFDERMITPWERVTIAGIQLPGLCRVTSPGRPRKVGTYSGPGEEVEELLDFGAQAGHVSIACLMWTPDHLARWEAFTEAQEKRIDNFRWQQVSAPNDAASVPAVEIQHPGLALARITTIYLTQIGVLDDGPIKGTKVGTILGTEYREKKREKAKSQKVKPVVSADNDFSEIERMEIAPELQAPSNTESGP